MKPLPAAVAVLAVFLLAPLAAAQPTGTIAGTVTDRVTGAGIDGVTIVLYTRQAVRYETTSGPTGAFRVIGMQPGTYEARFEKAGYTAFRQLPQQTALAAGQEGRVQLEMTRQIALRGRVTDAEGNPAAGVQIRAMTLRATTDDAGEFALEGATPGSYSILAVPPAPGEGGSGQVATIPTYYNSGRRVLVRGDADIGGLDIRLETAPVYSIRGTVVDQTSNPAAGVSVQLYAIDRRDGDEIFLPEALVLSGEDGSFEFSGVRPGDWQVTANSLRDVDAPNFSNTWRSGSATVVVGGRNIEGLLIHMAAPFTLTGTAEWNGTPPVQLMVRFRSADGRQSRVPLPPVVEPNGAFQIEQVAPGRYYIEPAGLPNRYVSRVMLGSTDITDRAVDLVPGSPPLHIVYAPAQGSVRGRVSEGVDATVLLFRRGSQGLVLASFTRPGADGAFVVGGLAPGDYVAAAFNRLDTGIYRDPLLMEHIAATGARVTVGSTAVSVDLRATRWPE